MFSWLELKLKIKQHKIILLIVLILLLLVIYTFVYLFWNDGREISDNKKLENTQLAATSTAIKTNTSTDILATSITPVDFGGGVGYLYKDIIYAKVDGVDSKYHSLDLYLPKNQSADKLPLIIYIHGGSWLSGSKDGCFVANDAIKAGYVVACLNYRLSQTSVFPAQIYDIKAAVRWLRANANQFNLDINKFASWGHSAGGHLTALLATSQNNSELEGTVGLTGYSSGVQIAIDWSGPTDFSQILDKKNLHEEFYSAAGQLLGGIGEDINDYQNLISLVNPITYVTKDDPPFLIIHGKKDEIVPPSQSKALYEVLVAGGVKAEYKIVDDGHFLDGQNSPPYIKKSIEFLNKVFNW